MSALSRIGLTRPIYDLVVDYNLTLPEMIQAGNYDWVDSNINSANFPIVGQGVQKRRVELFHFNRFISSDAAIKEMDAEGHRPAKLEELLALGKAQPELQRQFPIVALGSVWRYSGCYREVPCLCRDASGRGLYLHCFNSDWAEFYRFLACRKQAA